MAYLGWFDGELKPDAWFDAELSPAAWFDTEIVSTVSGGGSVAYALTCAVGSYTVAGQASGTLKRGHGLVCAAGAYAATGQASGTLKLGHGLTCAAGSYMLAGQAATLGYSSGHVNYSLTCANGSYTYSGITATLSRAAKLTAAVGSYSATGKAASLTRNVKLIASAGSYALAGNAITTQRNIKLLAEQGSYALTGKPATYVRAVKLYCDAGSYSQAGKTAAFKRGYSLFVSHGSYTTAGGGASLTHAAGSTHYDLGCSSGAYAVTGQATALALVRHNKLTAEVGSYALSVDYTTPAGYVQPGYWQDNVILTHGVRRYVELVAESGAYSLSGFNARATFEVDMIIGPTAAEIAAAIIAAAQVTPIHADVQKMNSATVFGTGVEADKWRGNV